MSATAAQNVIAVVGIDIGKNSFHVIALDDRGAIVLRQKWSRGQVSQSETQSFRPRCQADAGEVPYGHIPRGRRMTSATRRRSIAVRQGQRRGGATSNDEVAGRFSDLGMSASPPTPDVWLRRR